VPDSRPCQISVDGPLAARLTDVSIDFVSFAAAGNLVFIERMDEFFAAGLEKMILPGTGHFPHLERPAEVNAKIVEFLRRPWGLKDWSQVLIFAI
jgi:pimeloyl-ACP methyl ester carboxylesterase